jgi:hypothetical protein
MSHINIRVPRSAQTGDIVGKRWQVFMARFFDWTTAKRIAREEGGAVAQYADRKEPYYAVLVPLLDSEHPRPRRSDRPLLDGSALVVSPQLQAARTQTTLF